MTLQVWPLVQSTLDARVVGAASTPEVFLAGWSLGGSVGQLLALAAQQHLNATMGKAVSGRQPKDACRCLPGRKVPLGLPLGPHLQSAPPPHPTHAQAPVVSTVLFAAPSVGDPVFARLYNSLVNSRNIRFTHDLVPQGICTPSMSACSGELPGVLGEAVSQGRGSAPSHTLSRWPVVAFERSSLRVHPPCNLRANAPAHTDPFTDEAV